MQLPPIQRQSQPFKQWQLTPMLYFCSTSSAKSGVNPKTTVLKASVCNDLACGVCNRQLSWAAIASDTEGVWCAVTLVGLALALVIACAVEAFACAMGPLLSETSSSVEA